MHTTTKSRDFAKQESASQLLSKEQKDERSVATKVDSSTVAGKIKKPHSTERGDRFFQGKLIINVLQSFLQNFL
jgi:hypothetical protein